MSFLTPWVWLALVGATAPLSGTVVNQEGKPVDGAIVWLVASNPNGPGVDEPARTRTVADGTFATPDDAPIAAQYQLLVLADRMEPTRGEWSPVQGGPAAGSGHAARGASEGRRR